MNDKQVIKYNLIKSQLMAMSFDWIAAPVYTRNGIEIYKNVVMKITINL